MKLYRDYYAFGMQMPGRYANDGYRYGFNGQEKDDEIAGSGNHYTAPFWEYDPRTGRRWNQDPKPNPSISNYATFANNPIFYSDPLGDTLRIKGGKETITYTPGMEYKGENKFISTAVSDLNKVYGTEIGQEKINDLHASEYDFNIQEASTFAGSMHRFNTREKGGGSIWYYTKGAVRNDGVLFKSFHILGHELEHAWERDRSYMYNFTMDKQGLKLTEHNAVAFENYLRASWGENDMRLEYTGVKIYKEKDPNFYLKYSSPLRKTEAYKIYYWSNDPGADNTAVIKGNAVRVNKETGEPVFK